MEMKYITFFTELLSYSIFMYLFIYSAKYTKQIVIIKNLSLLHLKTVTVIAIKTTPRNIVIYQNIWLLNFK